MKQNFDFLSGGNVMTDDQSTNESSDDQEVSNVIEPGNIIEVEVATIADFGVFVKCSNGEEG